MSPKVSVVIPVFNRPDTVRRAIDSVLAQTYQDFEIVVVDDASTDDTSRAVEASGDPRVRLIRHDRNRGGSASRNTGIRASHAPYVAFLDSDDEWLPTKLERQLDMFAQGGETLGMVYTGIERLIDDGSVVREMPRRCDDMAQTLLTENVVGGTSVGMVRRSVFDEVGGFDEALPAVQDLDMWLRICQRFSATFVPEILVRIWQKQDLGRISGNVAAILRGRELFFQKHEKQLVQHGVSHLYLSEFGWVQQRHANNPRAARALYARAISARPTSASAYVLLLATYLPLSWLDGAARCKRLLTGTLKSDRKSASTDPDWRNLPRNLQSKPSRDSVS